MLARARQRQARLYRLQKLLQQFSKRITASQLTYEAFDALRARTSQHGLGELEILGPQLGVRKRIFGVSPRTCRFRNELATVVQRDLHACPSLGWKKPRIFAVLGGRHDADEASYSWVRELRHIDLLGAQAPEHERRRDGIGETVLRLFSRLRSAAS